MGKSTSAKDGVATLLEGNEPVSRGVSAIGGDLLRIHCSRALLNFLGPHLHFYQLRSYHYFEFDLRLCNDLNVSVSSNGKSNLFSERCCVICIRADDNDRSEV